MVRLLNTLALKLKFSEFHICFSLNIWCKVTVRIQNFLNITLCSLKLSALILYNEIE